MLGTFLSPNFLPCPKVRAPLPNARKHSLHLLSTPPTYLPSRFGDLPLLCRCASSDYGDRLYTINSRCNANEDVAACAYANYSTGAGIPVQFPALG